MKCFQPVYIHPVGLVPCGKCMGCRVQRSAEWATRLMQECSFWEHSSFLTLTYNNEHLPENGSLVKEELQKFFKRLRFNLGKDRRIKYYACGEYGDRFARPHYHSIVFGIGSNDIEIVRESWGKGFVKGGNVTYDSAKYVAGYIQKKYSGTLAAEVYGEKLRPFQTQSKGLGLSFVNANKINLVRDLGFTVKGQFHSLPRYYVKKLEEEIPIESLEGRREARKDELMAFLEAHGLDLSQAKQYEKELREQRMAELVGRLGRYRERKF